MNVPQPRLAKSFDLNKAIADAWATLWQGRQESAAEGHDYRGHSTYLTATDLEREVRESVQKASGGWRTVRISTGYRGGLLQACRAWLFQQVSMGKLEEFNMGRGHISGSRFRPAGSGITEREQKTMKEKERQRTTPRPKHLSVSGNWGGSPLCTKARRTRWSWRRTQSRTTSVREDVTCVRCKNIMSAEVR